jgi:Spy/CpxP family protein refolding chaperone
MTPRGTTRLKIWLVVLGVFVLGCVTGASLDSLYRLKAGGSQRTDDRGGRRGDIFEKMKSDLNLTEQQATDVRAIIDQSREEFRALRNEVSPRYDAVRAAARSRIRALLNAEQQQRFDTKMAERDAHREEDKKRDH